GLFACRESHFSAYLTLWFPLLIWWTPLCLIRQILTRRFRLYAYRNLTTYPHTKNKYRTGNITIHHYKIIFMLPVIFMPSQAQKIINNPPRSMQIKENTFHMKYHDIYIARSDGVFMKQFK
ncbi:hypothetical protein, partial [Escherichia coli]|uniref:hypothetical protein n=1 Tax=Escherichia coli TaxID=562 RepID=UPI001BB15AF4